MPALLRLREEQLGVVGSTATLWAIEDGRLCRRCLVNDRVVSEETRELQPAALERVRLALRQVAAAGHAASLAAPVGVNLGKLVLEADGKRPKRKP